MRTNIEIDDELIREAMTRTGLSTKKATVEEALTRLIRSLRQQEALGTTLRTLHPSELALAIITMLQVGWHR